MARKRSIPEDAEGTTVYLTPDDQIIVRAILAKRKKRSLPNASLNEIWIDALWLLAEREGFTRKKLEAFLSDD